MLHDQYIVVVQLPILFNNVYIDIVKDQQKAPTWPLFFKLKPYLSPEENQLLAIPFWKSLRLNLYLDYGFPITFFHRVRPSIHLERGQEEVKTYSVQYRRNLKLDFPITIHF